MTRLIDADALKETINAHDYVLKDCTNSTDKGMFTVGIMQAIDAQPTIDAEPVRHGKWFEYPIADGMNQCSVCGVLRFGESNYCPECGADMRGEEEWTK